MKLFKLKLGFTLSEVLITLGIIGVVAAITIPGLITKFRESQYRVAYKKTYSSLNQAIKYMQEEGDVSLDLSGGATSDNGTYSTSKVGEIFVYLSRYYNARTTCFENNADKCWVCEKGEAGSLYGGAPDWLGCGKYNYAFIDASGIAYYLYSNKEYPIIIDVNGTRAPNQLGRDRFVMKFSDSINPRALYPDNIDSVLPIPDNKNKGRWCPQGDCLYTSWVRNSH